MEVRIFDIATEFLSAVIESARQQGWDLASAVAHSLPDPAIYHCVFMTQPSVRGELILSAYAPIGKL